MGDRPINMRKQIAQITPHRNVVDPRPESMRVGPSQHIRLLLEDHRIRKQPPVGDVLPPAAIDAQKVLKPEHTRLVYPRLVQQALRREGCVQVLARGVVTRDFPSGIRVGREAPVQLYVELRRMQGSEESGADARALQGSEELRAPGPTRRVMALRAVRAAITRGSTPEPARRPPSQAEQVQFALREYGYVWSPCTESHDLVARTMPPSDSQMTTTANTDAGLIGIKTPACLYIL